jgi:2-polyprenyl-6-methoxyphenol hydroxylase-like FAD-dependent oxidoreductase
LVVGAGPTGLALACALAQRGVPCRVIDRRERPAGWSKANLINPRTLEILAGLGIGQRVVAEGVPVRATRVLRGARVVAAFESPPFPQTPYPYALQIAQARLEAILEERLAALGVTVERGVGLRDFRQERGSVTATVDGTDGREELRAAFLVGCDGAHSTVRERLGLPFTGEIYPESFIVADLHADWAQPAGTNLMWLYRDGVMLAWACREPGLWHLFFNLTAEQDWRIATPNLDDVRQIVADRTGDRQVHLDRPEWISKFGVQRRRVGQYRVGRVFLAGDAAHIHSPMVGKGLGIGIQDGASLGEKLARVLRGEADLSLLDAYQREREPVTVDVFREAHATHRLMIPRSGAAAWARDGFMHALRSGALQRWLFARNFQL